MISICRPTCSSFLRIYNIFIEMVQAHGWHHFKLVSRSIKVMKWLFFVLMNKPWVVSKVHKTDYLSRNKILKQPYSFSTFINDLLVFCRDTELIIINKMLQIKNDKICLLFSTFKTLFSRKESFVWNSLQMCTTGNLTFFHYSVIALFLE